MYTDRGYAIYFQLCSKYSFNDAAIPYIGHTDSPMPPCQLLTHLCPYSSTLQHMFSPCAHRHGHQLAEYVPSQTAVPTAVHTEQQPEHGLTHRLIGLPLQKDRQDFQQLQLLYGTQPLDATSTHTRKRAP